MPSKSKRKGNLYEAELVKKFEDHMFEAVRAWGSNGRSIGMHEEVDVLLRTKVGEFKVQAKRRARLTEYVKPSEHVDMVVMREDRGEDLAVVRLEDLLNLIKRVV